MYENAIALSLTCQKLYNMLFMLHKPTPRHNGREIHFLRLLERDFPNKMACPIHERLYDWQKQKDNLYSCPSCHKHRSILNRYAIICNKGCKHNGVGISESERRLILRSAILGPEHGLPMSLFEHICSVKTHGKADTVVPKLVNGSLMLVRSHHFYVQDIFHWDVSHWDNSHMLTAKEAICEHSHKNLTALLALAVEHAVQKRSIAKIATDWPCWIYPPLIKCNVCATDVRLRMELVGQNSLVVRTDAYQDLGGLQDTSISQRQVVSAVYDRRTRDLTLQEKAARFAENLELRFHDPDAEKSHILRFCCEYSGEYELEFLQDWECILADDGTVSYYHTDSDREFEPDNR